MSDIIQVADLEKTKFHNTFHVEAVTGKVGGLAGGADIDFTTNAVTGQVQKTLPKIINDLDWSPVGKFADGVTFTKTSDFALDGDNTQWIYIGAASFPVTVAAGFNPSGNADYQVIHVSDHNQTTNRNAVGAHDAIYRRETTVAEIATGVFSVGDRLTVTDRGNAPFNVVSGGVANGKGTIDAGVGKTAMVDVVSGFLSARSTGGFIVPTTTAKRIYLPSGEYDANSFEVGSKVHIYGDAPSYDPITGEKKGTWLNGVLSSAGAKSMTLIDVGIDARTSSINEGVVFSDPIAMTDVNIDRVIVIAKAEANHCLLIENVRNANVGAVALYGGVQGLAIKAEVFNVGAIFAFDQTTWGCTVRYSPSAPCANGDIGYIYCGTVNNAKGGGVICMNDQQGAALKNISFGKVIIEGGNAGFYIANGGNTVPAENIVVDDIFISGVTDFAIQTFGNPNGFKVGRAHLKNCAGSVFHNGGDPQDHELNNITIENTPAPALLSGDNHKLRGWSKKGGSGGTFVQNESINLQVWDMDARVAAVINQNGGTQFAGGATGDVTYPANGNLPAMAKRTNIKVQKSLVMAQNASVLLYALPAGSSLSSVNLEVAVFSQAGTHTRVINVTRDAIVYLNSSTSASSVFSIEKAGVNINLKYIFATTGSVDINCSIQAFHEA